MIGLHDGSPPPSERANHTEPLSARVFAEGGLLEGGLGLLHRPQQEAMARAVAAAMAADEPLLFEAGTGVGKSLAYLVPGIIQAVDLERQLIVSTHTISLQEQIEGKDLPLCRRLFESAPELSAYAGFRSAVLVGKSNYLCTTRLAHALTERGTLIADDEHADLERIAAWAQASPNGIRHELRPPPKAEVWDAVNADSAACSRKRCDGTKCFYQRARARLRGAQVIIVNHALLFALINSAGGRGGPEPDAASRGVLFPGDFLVLDEAHTVPEVATDNFGLALSSYSVERLLKHLYNPRNNRGLLARRGGAAARQLVQDALDASRHFFGFLDQTLLARQPVVRLREAGVAEPLLDVPLEALHRLLAKEGDRLEEGHERDEILEQRQRVKGVQVSLNEWLGRADPGHVYWAERGGRRQTIVTLRSAPLDVAPELRRHLFGRGVSVACTSATLAIGGEIDPFARRVGADAARSRIVASPFDYERNVRIYVAADVPVAETRNPQSATRNQEALSDYIRFCTGRVAGGTLVLFTSYADLRAVAAALAPDFAAAGRPLLVQGEDLSRSELADRMRLLGNAVLFGTDSFWTGVDVPGDALSQVIVTRLPFDPPTHPVTEARAERIQEEGGNPFNELTLPDALVKFRQGIGRLIRTSTDRGLITLLDSRILSKRYGLLFVQSLPKPEFEQLTTASREARFHPFA